MDQIDLLGHSLDGKYHIERELGRGGMGTVYLATHLGTERPVAVKVISPQYMKRGEFVERFRREARAAGRLRHPNVVNVTDFGFANTNVGQVAYLVMEYLDGCTLGEILDEEGRLPVGWTLDILEQVCSAVQAAHDMGIIHRDLKPDNIWLEPNQRGGYTVKVLDFGIAKLEEQDEVGSVEMPEEFLRSTHTLVGGGQTTIGGDLPDDTHSSSKIDTNVAESATISDNKENATMISDGATIEIASIVSEQKTAIFNETEFDFADQESVHTRVLSEERSFETDNKVSSSAGFSLYSSQSSGELTHVGAVLGTPLYMSPEQCRGEHLDQRSDIYSLGVIAYQMLGGHPPFEGNFKDVMESHKTQEPQRLKAKKVRRKMKRVIHSALSKEPEKRPQTAEAFASEMRAREEGIYGLVSRALVIYSEHLLKFLVLTAVLFIPPTILTIVLVLVSFLKVSESLSEVTTGITMGVLGIAFTLANAFSGTLILGTIAWIVTQNIAIPLRPVRLRPALREAQKKWKRFAGAGAVSAVLPFLVSVFGAIAGALIVGAIFGLLYFLTGSLGSIFMGGAVGAIIGAVAGFFISYTAWMLVAPVVMMEDVTMVEAFRRSRKLVRRSFATAAGAAILMFLIPAVTAGSISFIVKVTARAFDPQPNAENSKPVETTETAGAEPVADEPKARAWNWSLGGKKMSGGKEMDMRTRLKETLLESLITILWLPMQILVFSFSAIIVALLYIKTRLAGGESMGELIERFEDDGRPKKKWQERVRARLIQSGRVSSNPSR